MKINYIHQYFKVNPTHLYLHVIKCPYEKLELVIQQELNITIKDWDWSGSAGCFFIIDVPKKDDPSRLEFVPVLFIDEKDNLDSTIVHECVHAAYNILDIVGCKHDVKNHEWLAYTVDYIFDSCKEILKNKSNRKTMIVK